MTTCDREPLWAELICWVAIGLAASYCIGALVYFVLTNLEIV